MQLRLTRTSRNGTTYEYAQLVQSYRRPSDGLPTHRVVANLGKLSVAEIENLRTALNAAREGKRVALVPVPRANRPACTPVANLRYLDLAVLRDIWNEWSLTDLLAEAIPKRHGEIEAPRVVQALTMQRCLDPGSKLFATRWVPRTALPELLGFAPAAFNNTRVHRVLDELDAAGPAVMARLPARYQERQGAFTSLFLDVTDTWFVGHGPELAARGKTKEGRLEWKIGIVLLCNQQGYPLRWEVVGGTTPDNTTMADMLRSVAHLSWAQETPVVMDRAMGTTASIQQMLQTNLRFVTALKETEFDSYGEGIPYQRFGELRVSDEEDGDPQDVFRAAQLAENAGLKRILDDLYVRDLGTVERAVEDDGSSERTSTAEMCPAEAMGRCRQMLELVANGQFSSFAAAGRSLGLGESVAVKYRSLRGLSEEIQRQVLKGHADGCSLGELLGLARVDDPDEQGKRFAALLEEAATRSRRRPVPKADGGAEQLTKIRVRVVCYFNPERFVDERARAQRLLKSIAAFEAELNNKLARPNSRQQPDGIRAAIDRELRRNDLVQAFHVSVREVARDDRNSYRVEIKLDGNEWARRRRYDGFTLLITHPSLTDRGEELCRLYRAKDVVEKDFQVIKSVVELRPVRHRNQGKIRAHVTLCMLALLLERTLGEKLRGKYTAHAALEILESCRLNQYGDGQGQAAYGLTRPTPDQLAILRHLRLQLLADDAAVAEHIMPR